MNGRILVFGSKGQLGTELLRALSPDDEIVALSRADASLTQRDAVRTAVEAAKPGVIINAAAYTAVDRAEKEPDLAHAVNAEAPAAMAEAALGLNAWLLHFSTDYVFDGSGSEPWTEGDSPNPLNIYGRSKLAGEQAIAATGCNHLIFRTSWVYASHGGNFLRTMLRLGAERPALRIVDDQIGAPTSANELARASAKIVKRIQDSPGSSVESGIYHMTCGGSTSWFGFAGAIFKRVEGRSKVPSLSPITSEEFPTPAARPCNSRLNCAKLERATGIRLADWQDALDEVIREL